MIKFFRKIRQKLLTENKFGRYLTYAIGEIILVVIGILIALSINNWNEKRKESQIEIKALIDLKNEFIDNKLKMEESIEAVTAGDAAIEPGDQGDTADAGGEDSLPAAPDDVAGQKAPAENGSRTDTAYAASEPGHEDSLPERKNKALN